MSRTSIPRIVISGLRGGSGKTVLSLILITAWRKKGLKIAAFKKGPDYIDSGWMAKAAAAPCYNLDLFMMTPSQIERSFVIHSARDTNIAVIEGNRGLYDGVDHRGTYSTAGIAKLLKAPVLIVVDCTKATNTIAAMILGCQRMDPGVNIRGVVLNRVATGRQESLIRMAIKTNCRLPVLGAIPRFQYDPFPERHMGLVPSPEHGNAKKSFGIIMKMGERYLDLEAIERIANEAPPLAMAEQTSGTAGKRHSSIVKIGIIKDSAFQFYYEENFEELKKRGSQLIDVTPLKQKTLPDIDALYIGGGFPETHAIALSENISFKYALADAVTKGLPVYAECGGFMYLGESLVLDGRHYPMTGVLPVVFGLERKPQAHGYTLIKVERENPYFRRGSLLRGHEFHYSRILEMKSKGTFMAFRVKRGEGIRNGMDGICYNNVLATYTHLNATGTPEWADGLVRRAREYRKTKIPALPLKSGKKDT